MLDNVCVCCGKDIPEGRQVCRSCEVAGQKMGLLNKPAVVTNGDRIRAMDNEQLAEFLNAIMLCCNEETPCSEKYCPIYEGCARNVMCVERWLGQEEKPNG